MGGMSISEYRKFIFSLCEDLSITNLHSMKFLCRDLLTARERESIGDSATEFILVLEQRRELGSKNFNLLEDLLKQIKRADLLRKLKDFKRKQHRGNDTVVADKPNDRFPLWKCDLQDDVTDATDAKLPTALPANSDEDQDSQQASITPRGELYIILKSNYSNKLNSKSKHLKSCVRRHNVDYFVMRDALRRFR